MAIKLTKDQINRKMAEIAGWTHFQYYPGGNVLYSAPPDDYNEDNPTNPHLLPVPDYCNDLNLVREVELKLVEDGLGGLYFRRFAEQAEGDEEAIYGPYELGLSEGLLADAETRCLAIIKTWDSTQMEKEKE